MRKIDRTNLSQGERRRAVWWSQFSFLANHFVLTGPYLGFFSAGANSGISRIQTGFLGGRFVFTPTRFSWRGFPAPPLLYPPPPPRYVRPCLSSRKAGVLAKAYTPLIQTESCKVDYLYWS